MKYKLTVIKYEKNENYEAEMAKWKEHNRYSNNFMDGALVPQTETADRSLEVFLTEEEYKRVKAEVVKVFE